MQLEDYFDFNTTPVEHIRVKGTRIDIDHVIEMFLEGIGPDKIADRFHTLELVQVYAAITYFLQNRETMDGYLARREELAERYYQQSLTQPPSPAVERLRAIKAAQAAAEAS
jgi:uncharacterized protein (DUF433 family)